MEVMGFLKAVPAVIGIAGLLTYFVRAPKPESDLELANIVQRVRNTFLLLGCAALIMLSAWRRATRAHSNHASRPARVLSRRKTQQSARSFQVR